MRWAGENGVAAYGVLMYVSAIFQAIFVGYSVGTSPVIGYHYGAQNYDELKSLRKKGLMLTIVFSIVMFITGQSLAKPLSLIFVSYDETLLNMTLNAFRIFSFSFLLSGFGVFGSAFFTALNDGATSALISFLRTMVFQCSMVIILPMIWELNGVWMSVVAAEALATIMTVLFLIVKQKKYHY
jgi:Na+-driven multidrug efflux pump